MADKVNEGTTKEKSSESPEKRKLDKDEEEDDSAPPVKKKFSMGFSPKKPEMKKITMNFGAPKPTAQPIPIKMSLSTQKTKESTSANVVQKTSKVASVFNPDDDSDEEEMPPEAKMRMRNIGRDTPTAAGPNSFGKSRLGFCDRQKILERELKAQMDKAGEN